MMIIKEVPFVKCETCSAMYFYPSTENKIRTDMAIYFVTSRHTLDKSAVRFLRLHFNLTQEQVSKAIGVDVKEYNKFESKNSTRNLSPDRHVRLKLFYANLLNITDSKVIYSINVIDDSEFCKTPTKLEMVFLPEVKQA